MDENRETPDPRRKGWTLAHEGRYQEAVDLLERAGDTDPSDNELWNLLGKAYYHLGRKREAKACWRRVLSQDPGDAVAYSCLHRASTLDWRIVFAGLLGILCGAGFIALCRDRSTPPKGMEAATPAASQVNVSERRQVAKSTPTSFPVSTAVPAAEPTSVPTSKPMVSPAASLTSVPTTMPVPAPSATPVPASEKDISSLYEEAIQAFREEDLEGCKERLSQLEAMALPLELRDNVLFWQGECLYVEKRYEEAKGYFERVLKETPDGSKALEAELLVAFCQIKTGPEDQARQVLEEALEREDVPERLKEAARRAL